MDRLRSTKIVDICVSFSGCSKDYGVTSSYNISVTQSKAFNQGVICPWGSWRYTHLDCTCQGQRTGVILLHLPLFPGLVGSAWHVLMEMIEV